MKFLPRVEIGRDGRSVAVSLKRIHRLNAAVQPIEAAREASALIDRLSITDDPATDEAKALARIWLGYSLEYAGQHEAALAEHRRTIDWLGESPQPGVRFRVAQACRYRAHLLMRLDRQDEAAEALRELIRRFALSRDRRVLPIVASAYSELGDLLGKLGRHGAQLSTCNEAIGRFGEARDVVRRDLVLSARLHRADALRGLGRLRDALEAYDRLGGDLLDIPRTGKQDGLLASSLVGMGICLSELGEPREAIQILDEQLALFGQAIAPEVTDSVVYGMLLKAAALRALGRSADSVAACDGALAWVRDRIDRLGQSHLDYRRANALVAKAAALGDLSRWTEALDAADEATSTYARHGWEPDETLARATLERAAALERSERLTEALDAYASVDEATGSTAAAPAWMRASARVYRTDLLLRLDRLEEAIVVAARPEPDPDGRGQDDDIADDNAMTQVNAAEALRRLGRADEATAAAEAGAKAARLARTRVLAITEEARALAAIDRIAAATELLDAVIDGTDGSDGAPAAEALAEAVRLRFELAANGRHAK